MINWKEAKERWIEGAWPGGRAWIRVNLEGETLAAYLCPAGLDTQKFLPETGLEDPEFCKLILAEEVEKLERKLKLIA